MTLSIADVSRINSAIYKNTGFVQRLLSTARPYICPFHTMVELVPKDSSILDIGCGSGVFLNLLVHQKTIKKGIGFDASQDVINTATKAMNTLDNHSVAKFQCRQVEEGLPDGDFDVVSMIDVMHHIPPESQQDAFKSAAHKLSKGGVFIYKDIGQRPLWRAWGNRIHDLILAQEWIHYVPTEYILDWAKESELSMIHRDTINMFWYGHELFVFKK